LALTKVTTGTIADDSIQSLKNRNLVINGAMQVAQRGTSQAGITGPAQFVVDRMRTGFTLGTGAYTLNHSTNAPDGFANSYHIDVTTAMTLGGASDGCGMVQLLEGQDLQHIKKGTADAESLTLSFWIKSTKTGTYIAELYDFDNARHISKSYTVNSSNTWEKKEITFPGDTTGSLDNDNLASFGLLLFFSAGTNYTSGTLNTSWGSNVTANRAVGQVNALDSTSNDIYITGVQLEVGDVATPFEHRSYGEELALCQRYYNSGYTWVTFNSSTPNSSSTYFHTSTSWPTMRIAPTLTLTAPASGNTGYIEEWGGTDRAISSTNHNASNLSYVVLTSGITTVNSCQAHLKMDAEL